MTAFSAVLLPSLVLACVLGPLLLSLNDIRNDPPGRGDPNGGVERPDPPSTGGDSASVDLDAVELRPVDTSYAVSDPVPSTGADTPTRRSTG